MKPTGIIRRLDELGRVVIPKEIRKKLEIDEKDPIEICIDEHSIILRKPITGCIFCNNSKDLCSYKEKLICKNCLVKLSKMNSDS